MAQKILMINRVSGAAVKKSSGHIKKRKGSGSMSAKKKAAKKRKNPIGHAQRAAPKKKRHTSKRRNPIGKSIRRRMSPRMSGAAGAVHRLVTPALTASAGALLLDILWGNLPLPASVKVGNLQFIAKAAGALGLVKLVHSVTGDKAMAEKMGMGSLTVLSYDFAKSFLKKSVPGLHLGEYVGDGGDLDYANPLNFYYSAPEGHNTIPNYPQALPPAASGVVPVPGAAVAGMGEYISGYYDDDDDDDGMGEFVSGLEDFGYDYDDDGM